MACLFAGSASAAAELQVSVVNDKGEPVSEAVVYVVGEPPQEAQTPGEPYLVDQVDKTYLPHVIAVPLGSKVNFPNSDNIRHHVYSFSPAKKFEIPLYQGVPADPITMDRPGIVALGCNIHDWMSGYIFVAESPWFAVTDETGKARLSGLPADEVELEVWHETLRGDRSKTRRKVILSDSEHVELKIRQKKVFSAFRGAASRTGGYR